MDAVMPCPNSPSTRNPRKAVLATHSRRQAGFRRSWVRVAWSTSSSTRRRCFLSRRRTRAPRCRARRSAGRGRARGASECAAWGSRTTTAGEKSRAGRYRRREGCVVQDREARFSRSFVRVSAPARANDREHPQRGGGNLSILPLSADRATPAENSFDRLAMRDDDAFH